MAGFSLRDIGVQAGLNLLQKQATDDTQANIDLKQAQTAQMKMSTMAAQQKVEMQKAVGNFLKSAQATDETLMSDPLKVSKLYSDASTMALQHGDFEGAQAMSAMARGKQMEAKENQSIIAEKQQLNKENLSQAAMDYSQNQTEDNAKRLTSSAIAAGVNPAEIPKAGTPEFGSWVSQQTQSSMTGKDRMKFIQDQQQHVEKLQEKRDEFKERMDDRREARQQTALLREAVAGNKAPKIQEFEGRKYQWDPNGSVEGKRDRPDKGWVEIAGATFGKNQERDIAGIVGASAEALRGLRIVMAMPPGTTAGPFQNLKDGTVIDALSKTGGNYLTPQNMQMYQTAAAGLGLEVGRVLTLGGGRGPTQALIHEFQNVITIHPGDTNWTAMFKIANAADIVRNRLMTLPDSSNDKVKHHQQETEELLKKIPLPEEIYAAAAKSGQNKAALDNFRTMKGVADKIKDSGSVSDDKSDASEINALVNKWAPKK